MADVNIVEFGAAIEGSEPLARVLAPWVEALKADPNTALEVLARELPEPDRAVLRRPPVWALIRKSFSESVRQGDCGWMDDDLAFVKPWGFDPAAICVPVRLWQGELDVLVPRSHGEYLAARIPGASFELVPNEGHLLFDHVPTVMRWLVAG
jgi:pimeloyl-ACP methyl ester carboxylesterase